MLLHWEISKWLLAPDGSWAQQPVILVDGSPPFLADTPEEYIGRLQVLHSDPNVERGSFHRSIGELKDAMENIQDPNLPHYNRAKRRANGKVRNP